MTHRVFKPVILFHDHSFSTDPSGVTHRIHIPYGDPHYTPLIQQKKHKVEIMLKSNGRAWYDIIKSSRQPLSPKPSLLRSPQSPPLLIKDSKRERPIDKRPCTQLLLQHYGSNRHYRKMEDEYDSEDDNQSTTSSSLCSSSTNCSSITSPVPTTANIITRKRRGNLPKTVTAVLKQWLIDHCRNPYPTEAEKTGLKDKTGLTLNQISNWFINARRRLLPQILDTIHPNHKETDVLQQEDMEDPMPLGKRRRKATKMDYLYEEDLASVQIHTPTTVIRKRRRYNKRTPVSNQL